ncbi:MAG: hypothetical protein R2880_18660 [Deinococcales bacterium]
MSPQLILLLAYMRLEKVPSRGYLAALFWPYAQNDFTKKGERKDLKNLSSALATIRREALLDPEDGEVLAQLSCDVHEASLAIEQGDYGMAHRLFSGGEFLAGLEHKPRLNLSTELLEWLYKKRQQLSRLAAETLLALSQEARAKGDMLNVKHYSESLFELSQKQPEPALLNQLYQLLLYAGSDLAKQVRHHFESYIDTALEEGRLNELSLRLFLALSLQEPPNLAAIQASLNISPKSSASYLEELIAEGLVGAGLEVLASDIAKDYLDKHPTLSMELLGKLRDYSPERQALSVFRALYQRTQSFGGMGYWPKAREAYRLKALDYFKDETFAELASLLDELKEAEDSHQQSPLTSLRFLHAYAFERLRQPQKGLAVLENVEADGQILALKSALLLRTSDYHQAKTLAEEVLQEARSSSPKDYSRAIAANTLGQIAYGQSLLEQASYYYDEATSQWQLAQVLSRELGAKMNHAIILGLMGEHDAAKLTYENLIGRAAAFPLLKTRAFVNLGYLYEQASLWDEALNYYHQAEMTLGQEALEGQDMLLYAQILNNLGYSYWQKGDKTGAHGYFERGLEQAAQSGERLTYALALGNLGAMQGSSAKLESALRLFNDIGHQQQEVYEGFWLELIEQKTHQLSATPELQAFYLEKLSHYAHELHSHEAIKRSDALLHSLTKLR